MAISLQPPAPWVCTAVPCNANYKKNRPANNLLDISKIETGKDILHKEDIKLEQLTSDLFSLLSALARPKDPEPNLENNDLLFCQTHTDIAKLKQIFISLIGNAIKFTDHGSVLIQDWAGLFANITSNYLAAV